LKDKKESSEELFELKNSLLRKENEILELKQSFVLAQKENLKIKSDRERLTRICSDLRKEINRLENNLKHIKRESAEEEEIEKNNEDVLYYQSPNLYQPQYIPQVYSERIYDDEKINEEKIKQYSNQIEKLKSNAKELESKFRSTK
jgi:hypothetical protein